MKLFKNIKAMNAAVEMQDGSNEKYLLLLVAIASIIKVFTGDKADAKIDDLLQKIAGSWGLVEIFASVEKQHEELMSDEHTA